MHAVKMAKCTIVKVELMFISCSGSNCSVFYLYRATSVGLSNNPLSCTCLSMQGCGLCLVKTVPCNAVQWFSFQSR